MAIVSNPNNLTFILDSGSKYTRTFITSKFGEITVKSGSFITERDLLADGEIILVRFQKEPTHIIDLKAKKIVVASIDNIAQILKNRGSLIFPNKLRNELFKFCANEKIREKQRIFESLSTD